MRITANIPDKIVHDLKALANDEGKSVSSLVAECIETSMRIKKKKAAKANILKMIGKVPIDEQALKLLDELRSADDRA